MDVPGGVALLTVFAWALSTAGALPPQSPPKLVGMKVGTKVPKLTAASPKSPKDDTLEDDGPMVEVDGPRALASSVARAGPGGPAGAVLSAAAPFLGAGVGVGSAPAASGMGLTVGGGIFVLTLPAAPPLPLTLPPVATATAQAESCENWYTRMDYDQRRGGQDVSQGAR